jgi:transcriptional regulator with PAS, ATPase and Fis domain
MHRSARSADGGDSESFERFPSCEDIARRLIRRFPSLDKEIVMDFAYAVSINRYDYGQAKQMLSNLVEATAVEVAVVDAVRKEEAAAQRAAQASSSSSSSLFEQKAVAVLERDHLKHHHIETTPQHGAPLASAMIQKAQPAHHPSPSSEVDSAGFSASEILLYSTSMTSIQQVRDHTRLLKNLLYIRRIRYSELDLADNAFLQRRLASLCGLRTAAELKLPVLFVGEKPVGGYEVIQDLEDRDAFMPALARLGFIYDPLPLPTSDVIEEDDDSDDRFYR